jgi:hypothetical protein
VDATRTVLAAITPPKCCGGESLPLLASAALNVLCLLIEYFLGLNVHSTVMLPLQVNPLSPTSTA